MKKAQYYAFVNGIFFKAYFQIWKFRWWIWGQLNVKFCNFTGACSRAAQSATCIATWLQHQSSQEERVFFDVMVQSQNGLWHDINLQRLCISPIDLSMTVDTWRITENISWSGCLRSFFKRNIIALDSEPFGKSNFYGLFKVVDFTTFFGNLEHQFCAFIDVVYCWAYDDFCIFGSVQCLHRTFKHHNLFLFQPARSPRQNKDLIIELERWLKRLPCGAQIVFILCGNHIISCKRSNLLTGCNLSWPPVNNPLDIASTLRSLDGGFPITYFEQLLLWKLWSLPGPTSST